MKNFSEIWLFAVLATGAYLVKLWQDFSKKKRLESMPTSKIKSAAAGRCELQGFAWPSTESLVNPISLTEVVFYRLEVFNRSHRGDTQDKIATIDRLVPFFVVDETGLALVKDYRYIETEALNVNSYDGSHLSAQQQIQLHGVLSSFSKNFLTGFSVSDFNYEISEIIPKDFIYAMGEFSKVSGLEKVEPRQNLSETLNEIRESFYRNKMVATKRPGIWHFFNWRSGYVPKSRLKELELCGMLKGSLNNKLILSNKLEYQLFEEYGEYIYLKFVGTFILFILLLLPVLISINSKFF